MRGRTFKKAFIVADEMQNATASQMKMLLTNLGKRSAMSLGDLHQANGAENNGSGFYKAIRFISRNQAH